MKQTNSAIKFLMAQYRSIFKQAYLKGLVSAVAITAGLAAASSANAAVGKPELATGDEYTVTSSNLFQVNQIDSGSSPVIVPWESDIKIESGTVGDGSSGNYIWHGASGSGAIFSGNGSLTISSTSDDTVGMAFGNGANSQPLSVSIESIDVQRGTLTILANPNASTKTSVGAQKITIGASGGSGNAIVNLNSYDTQSSTFGSGAVTLGNKESTLTLHSNATINFKGSGSTQAILDGASLVSNGAKLDFTIGSGTVKAPTYYENEPKSGSIVNVKVASAKTASFTLNSDSGNRGVFHFASGSTIDLQRGTLALESGGALVINAYSGTGSIVKIDSGVDLTSSLLSGASANTTSGASYILVSGAALSSSELHVDSTVLENFLKVNDKDYAGSVLLSGSSVLQITGTKTIELSSVNSKDTNTINFGSALMSGGTTDAKTGGKVVVSGTTTIKAESIQISNAIASAAGNLSDLSLEASSFTLGSADFKSSDTTANANGLKQLTIKAGVDDIVTLVAGSGDSGSYTLLSGTIVRDGSYYAQDSDGFNIRNQVNPAKELFSGANLTLDDSGMLQVEGGNWISSKDITILDGGNLTVIAASGTANTTLINSSLDDGKHSLVTLQGKLTFTSGSINVTGTSGANAVLDLSKTKVALSTNAGTITLGGTPTDTYASQNSILEKLDQQAGYGVLKVDGKQFLTPFLAADDTTNTPASAQYKTTLAIGSGGVLYVANPDSVVYNFSDFSGTSASAGVVAFTGAGYVFFDGDLKLTTGESTDSGDTLNIGAGTIVADTITLSNKHKTADKDGVESFAPVQFTSGTLVIHNALLSNSDKLILGSTNPSAANLKFYGEDGVSGTVGVNISTSGSSANKIDFKGGNWSTLNIDLATGADTDVLTIGSIDADDPITTVKTGHLASSGDTITVYSQGDARIATAKLAGSNVGISGSMSLEGNSTLVSGDAAFGVGLAGVDVAGSTFTVSTGGKLTLSDAILADTDTSGSGSITLVTSGDPATTTASIHSALKATYKIAQGAELVLDLSSGTASSLFNGNLNADEAVALKDALFSGGSLDGILNLGAAELDIVWDDPNLPKTKWENVKDFADITAGDVTTNKLKSALITNVLRTDELSGHYGAIQVDDSFLPGSSVQIVNNFGLHKAYAAADGKEYYIFKDNNGSIQLIDLDANNSNVTLGGGGNIGAVTVSDGDLAVIDGGETVFNGNVSVSSSAASNDDATLIVANATTATITGDLATEGIALSGTLNVSGESTVNSYMDINSGAIYNAHKINMVDADIMGQVSATDLALDATSSVAVVGGTLSADSVTLSEGAELSVGYEVSSLTTKDDTTTIFNDLQSYGGEAEFGQLTMKKGMLKVDPAYDIPTAFVAVNNLSGSATQGDLTDIKAGTLDGKVYVGRNSILGIGVSGLEELKEATAGYMHGLSLDGEDTGAVLYVNKQFKIAKDGSVILTALSPESFVNHYNSGNGTGTAGDLTTNSLAVANTMFLGGNTALAITANVTNSSVAGGGSAMIEFAAEDATVIADGGRIDLTGNIRANRTYQVFNDAKDGISITYLNGDDYDPSTKAIEVTTENGFLDGFVAADGTVTLGLAKDARSIMTGASDPVYTTLVAYANGYNGEPTKDPDTGAESISEDQKLHYGFKPQDTTDAPLVKDYNYNNDFLQQAITTGNGTEAEQVARLGIYGGSVQAAISAGATTYDAVAGRMGMGAQTGAVTFADNGQGAGLWVTPIYKSHDSDGFGAQGLIYGTDMSMYGLALGGDFTMANGMRVGAAFNVGSGDADGQGAGAGVSNDFDYYGFTVYGAYTMDKMSVVADVSYTAVDNDVSANTSLGKVSSTMDTTNMSFGVTGQYTLSMDAVDIVPHAGLRYTYVDMDDYTVKGADADQAHYAGDSMSIFSIPVGVTFSKEIVSGGWTVKPAFDLTLTANVGDDSIDGSVTWAGVDNLKTNLESEVVDSFTYGATLGVSAKSGNFSMGFGVNYTGASNADEYGVNANARFVF